LKFAAGPACREIGGLPNGGQQQQDEVVWREGLKGEDGVRKVFSLVRAWFAGLCRVDLMCLLRKLIAAHLNLSNVFSDTGKKAWADCIFRFRDSELPLRTRTT